MMPGGEFVSEPITPDRGTSDADAMARGQPGLPAGFTWRGRHYTIGRVLESWKQSEPESHRRGGERYYRKHYFRVLTDDGQTMTLYAVRHLKPGENPKNRWVLFSIDSGSG